MIKDQLFLKISGSAPTSPNAGQSWIKLTLDPPEKTSEITKAQLADWLDNAVGIEDHCTGATAEDAYNPADTEDSVEQRLQTALGGGSCYEAADLLAMQEQCSLTHRAGVPKKFNVYVHCSSENIRERYRFKSSSSFTPTGPTRREKIIQVIIDFTDAGEVPIYRYAESEEVNKLWQKDGYRPQWLGDVLIGTRRIKPEEEIGVGWINGRVVLTQPLSGRLVVFLPIKYDSWVVSVPGVIINGKRDYTATAYAFDESLEEPASVELDDEQDNPEEGSDCELCSGIDDALLPGDFATDPVTGDLIGVTGSGGTPCQLRTDWEKRNECTGDLLDYGTRYSDTQCPDKRKTEIDYTSEGTPDSAKWSAAEYQEACCEEPKRATCLPCKKIIRTYPGGAPILPSEQHWRDRYAPAHVVFNRRGREDELPCGTMTHEFVEPYGGCCPDAKLEYISDNPDIVTPGSSVTVACVGGLDTVTWRLQNGTGFEFANGEQEIVAGREVDIYATSTACGTVTVIADDGCTEVRGGLSSTAGQWVEIKNTLIGDGGEVECVVTGYVNGVAQRKKYIQDWCFGDVSTCDGTEQQVCGTPPPAGGLSPIRVEGERVFVWECA